MVMKFKFYVSIAEIFYPMAILMRVVQENESMGNWATLLLLLLSFFFSIYLFFHLAVSLIQTIDSSTHRLYTECAVFCSLPSTKYSMKSFGFWLTLSRSHSLYASIIITWYLLQHFFKAMFHYYTLICTGWIPLCVC